MAVRYLQQVWLTLQELSPWLLGGLAVAGLLRGLVPEQLVWRHLGRDRFGSVVKAVLLGVPLPLCSCGVIPAALGLRRHGAGDGAAIGFLISTPQTGVDSIFMSAAFLGWPFAWFKVFSAVLTGLAGGALTQLVVRGPRHGDAGSPPPPRGRIGPWGMVDHAVNDLLYTIRNWLALGVLVSAAISTWVPADYLAGTALGGPLAPLLVLALSLPLYVCATSSVPIAASLVAAGMSPGAALVFLMAGPASNVATLGAVYRGFGGRVLAVYLATIGVGSLVLGHAFDFVIAPPAAGVAAHHHGPSPAGVLGALLLLGLLGWFVVRDLRRWRSRQLAAAQSLVLDIGGMACAGCAGRVRAALAVAAGVSGVHVDLTSGRATVRGRDLDRARLEQVIRAAGFQVGADGG